jgi:pteridine reductase
MKEFDYTDRPLAGRVALVTGGARRVGATLVRELSRAGARVLVHASRSTAAAETLVRELDGPGAAIVADLRDPESPRRLLDESAARGFEPDILVHSAASFLRRSAIETTAAEWDDVQALNLRAFFLLATEIARRRGSRGGDLVAITDAAAVELWPGYLAHSVAKAGLVALVRALAKALAPAFRVNGVMPGPVLPPEEATAEEREAMRERTLLGRLGEPKHVAQAVLFLLTCDYATGSIVEVTGGSQLWRGSMRRPPGAP